MRFAISKLILTPASCAIAGKWSIVLVEQPSAISIVKAFLNDFSLIISLIFTLFLTKSMIFIPVCLANLILSAYTAGIVPWPGSAIPKTSHIQFIELAVYIPEQEPQPGQEWSSYSCKSSSVILPDKYLPTAWTRTKE